MVPSDFGSRVFARIPGDLRVSNHGYHAHGEDAKVSYSDLDDRESIRHRRRGDRLEADIREAVLAELAEAGYRGLPPTPASNNARRLAEHHLLSASKQRSRQQETPRTLMGTAARHAT